MSQAVDGTSVDAVQGMLFVTCVRVWVYVATDMFLNVNIIIITHQNVVYTLATVVLIIFPHDFLGTAEQPNATSSPGQDNVTGNVSACL